MSESEVVIRSVRVAVILDDDGDTAISYSTEGEPAAWEVLGMLDYVASVIRSGASFDGDDDEDES